MKHLSHTMALASFALMSAAGAAVVQNDALIATGFVDGGFPLERFFSLTKTAPPGDGMFLYQVATSSPNNFAFSYWGIAELNSLFLASAGDVFDQEFVDSQPVFASNSNNPGMGSISLQPGESSYLAYYDNRFFTDEDLFGWARITNLDGELVVEESATAWGGGIVVGTLTQVPEPGSGAIFALLTTGALMCRQKRGFSK